MLKQAIRRVLAAGGFELHRMATEHSESWCQRLSNMERGAADQPINTLEQFFDANIEGLGIWKWRHYFEIYHRHFARFIGRDVHVLEIGVYSGGSLAMWKQYFGPRAHIYGVDIEPACKAYQDKQTTILIGDQADPAFWDAFKRSVPKLDIVIDDGGHEPHQQIATMEALLPHLRPDGVFLCEDITFTDNKFFDYVCQFTKQLNAYDWRQDDDPERRLSAAPSPIQDAVHSVHFYPMVAVIERRPSPLTLVAPKHGTLWQPFIN